MLQKSGEVLYKTANTQTFVWMDNKVGATCYSQ